MVLVCIYVIAVSLVTAVITSVILICICASTDGLGATVVTYVVLVCVCMSAHSLGTSVEVALVILICICVISYSPSELTVEVSVCPLVVGIKNNGEGVSTCLSLLEIARCAGNECVECLATYEIKNVLLIAVNVNLDVKSGYFNLCLLNRPLTYGDRILYSVVVSIGKSVGCGCGINYTCLVVVVIIFGNGQVCRFIQDLYGVEVIVEYESCPNGPLKSGEIEYELLYVPYLAYFANVKNILVGICGNGRDCGIFANNSCGIAAIAYVEVSGYVLKSNGKRIAVVVYERVRSPTKLGNLNGLLCVPGKSYAVCTESVVTIGYLK